MKIKILIRSLFLFFALSLFSGNSVLAQSPPEIDSISPLVGLEGNTEIVIYGKNFNTSASNDVVYYGETTVQVFYPITQRNL